MSGYELIEFLQCCLTEEQITQMERGCLKLPSNGSVDALERDGIWIALDV